MQSPLIKYARYKWLCVPRLRDAKINVILVSIIAPIVTESTNHCTRLADPRPTKDQLKIADRI